MHRMPASIASGRRSPREWLPVLILALLAASSASADVAIKEKTVSEGLGGFGNGTTNRTLFVAGDKSRSEDEFTYTGRFKTLAGGGKPRTTLVITRLDKEVVWNVDPEKKQYTELTFADMRQMMAAGAAETDRNAQARDADMTFTVDVKRTGAKQEVNGFPAEQVVITCVGKPKTSEKGEVQGEFRTGDGRVAHEGRTGLEGNRRVLPALCREDGPRHGNVEHRCDGTPHVRQWHEGDRGQAQGPGWLPGPEHLHDRRLAGYGRGTPGRCGQPGAAGPGAG